MSDTTPPAVSEAMREAVAQWAPDCEYRVTDGCCAHRGCHCEEIARLTGERDEADRRAGAAERQHAEGLSVRLKMNEWRRKQKEARGYCDGVSFDRVWSETCALADRAEAAEADLTRMRAETERLRSGIQDIIDGNYDHPRRHRPGQCRHGIHYYDECGNCTDEALAKLLSNPEQTDA